MFVAQDQARGSDVTPGGPGAADFSSSVEAGDDEVAWKEQWLSWLEVGDVCWHGLLWCCGPPSGVSELFECGRSARGQGRGEEGLAGS